MAFSTQSQSPWNEDGFTYVSVRPNSTNETVTVDDVSWYRGQYSQPAESNEVFQQADARATFSNTAIAFDPKPRDTITPTGGNTHVVISVVYASFLRFWKLVCRDLVLAYDLRDTATIQRPTSEPGADGLRTFSLSALASNVPARLQPESMDSEPDTLGGLTQRTNYAAYLGQALELKPGDLIEVSSVKYEVQEQSVISQVDTLTTVRCTRIA
jgi:hypothetical protein